MTTTLSASEARSNFYNILDEVADKFKRFVITKRGKAKAVVMPAEEVEAWEETMEIMANKKLASDIKAAEKELKSGKGIPQEKLLKELGIKPEDIK